MSFTHFYKQLETLVRKSFPSVAEISPRTGVESSSESPLVPWDHLISPLEIQLPKVVLETASAAIKALYQVTRRSSYQELLDDTGGLASAVPANRSVLMAYDFHTNEQGECFLVEVNTNASGFLLASVMELVHRPVDLNCYEPWLKLSGSFTKEMELCGQLGGKIAIADEDLNHQKMLVEFLMYRDWFKRFGLDSELVDSRDFAFDGGKLTIKDGQPIGTLYNRTTDFYLEDPVHEPLRTAYLAKAACFTPNPREYWLLADKQRLVQFTEPGFLEKAGATEVERDAIKKVLIPTFEKSAFGSPEEIWAKRRSLFFKPKRSFGGKSVYRGESVSKKVFERLMADDILIQKFQPAQRMPVEDPRSVLSNWKFDLRFYVYEDQIQLSAARIYQGQVTNFSSPMGGFTSVRF